MGASWLLLHGAALILVVVAVTTTASAGEMTPAASVVVGAAKCADCGRKNMDAEAAFKGLKVAIKCKNDSSQEYESKAVGELDGTGAFAVPLAADLRGADCVAQLHSAASNAPCPGQEPSKIEPLSSESSVGTSTFVAVAGKTHLPSSSAECSSATICFPCHRNHMFHKKPLFSHRKPMPEPSPGCPPADPGYGQPAPECPPPTPAYGTPAPECPPATPEYPPPTPAYGMPAPERPSPTPECGQPAPEYSPPTPEYGTPAPERPSPTPECGQPAPECPPSAPEYGTPAPACPPPTPGYGSPSPFWPPVLPAYGTPSPTPIYRPPGSH